MAISILEIPKSHALMKMYKLQLTKITYVGIYMQPNIHCSINRIKIAFFMSIYSTLKLFLRSCDLLCLLLVGSQVVSLTPCSLASLFILIAGPRSTMIGFRNDMISSRRGKPKEVIGDLHPTHIFQLLTISNFLP